MRSAAWQRIVMCLVALWGLGLARAEDPATKPAATQPATAASAPAQDEDSALPRALLKAGTESFVIVEVWYKKDLSESAQVLDRDYRIRQMYEEYVDQKRSDERSGVVLDDKGHILVIDDGLEDRFLDRLVVKDASNKGLPAKRVKLLFDAPGVLLRVDEKAAKLKPLKFVPLKDADSDKTLFQARHFRVDDQWRIGASALTPAVIYGTDEPENLYFGYRQSGSYSRRYSGSPTIIANADGEPLGVGLAPFMDLRQTEILWKGPDLIQGKGIDWQDLAKAEQATRKALMEAVQEVVIRLRAGERDEYGPSSSGASGREINVYGVALNATDVFVPKPLTSQLAAQIDRLFIKFSPTRRTEAQFVGAFKDFGGFLVRLTKGKLPASVRLAKDDPPRMRPLWEARIRKRFGDKYVDLMTNRIVGKTRGYKGLFYWYAGREMTSGSMLVDFQGSVVGFNLAERLEHEEERRLESTGRYSRRDQRVRVFTIGEVREALTSIKAHLDPKIVVKSRSQAKRRAWLGVEYVPMTSDLAEQFKTEKPTKDGQLGFVVNAVYAGSPASKLGLKVGDILLRLKAPGMPYPIELQSRMAGGDGYGYRGRYYDYGSDEGTGPPSQSWKNRSNFLTRAFDAVGVGKKVELTYHRPDEKTGKGKDVTFSYQIEQAPPDVESASKWQNRKIGLTVKDMTYEIRHALSLTDADPGVLVAKVEDGSPMTVARIYPNEIITRLDDQPLKSARQMRDLIAKASKAGRQKARLTVLRLGKTRFADLAVTEYDPADDEGLDEDKE
ncbi:MAG TPA: PDZ domain-containing protein [Phycisphaerae bacterium]|nr:PDZ domain-containing protein [Phycisphaerae bacterium]